MKYVRILITCCLLHCATPPLAAELGAAGDERLDRILAGRPRVDGPLTVDQAVSVALRGTRVVRGAVQEVEAAVAIVC